MAKRYSFSLLAILLCLSLSAIRFEKSYAKEKKLTPQEVVAKHLESIGSPEALSAVKSRSIYGITAVQRPIGTTPQVLPEPGKRTDPTNFLFVSEGEKLGMIMKFYDQQYRGEHFAFDGKDASVGITVVNNRSQLGSFIYSYSGLMREGLLGGTLSTAWPLLNIKDAKFKLSYKIEDINGVKYHQLTYKPKSSRHLINTTIHIFLDLESYRHLMTEYVLTGGATERPTLIVLERFGSFKSVDGLMLPHGYSIEYSPFASDQPTRWAADIKQISHNEAIDPQNFHIQ
ncbi:MAG: hypothetical protein JXA73_12230 [Acidobacteria bacterium]|nr:hypothetical protein [Acidobacteriota bacterium]